MSWSLRVSRGDFVPDGSLSTVTDEAKLVQDLRHYLLERMGTDDLHPDYGSLIDGGRTPDGTEYASPIGDTHWNRVALNIESEIRRIANAYQQDQIERAKDDRLTYAKDTLTAGEILASVNDIRFIRDQDELLVNISISSARGNVEAIQFVFDQQAVTFT